MPAMTHPRSATLLDAFEIQQVLNKYPVALDSREPDLMNEVFAPKALVSIAGSPLKERAPGGPDMTAFDASQHLLGPASIEVEGDHARSRCYFIAVHTKNSLRPDPHLTIGGWYDDEWQRIDGEWRITKRIGTPSWFDGNPAVLGYPIPPGAFEWSEHRNCPAWLKPKKR